MIFTVISICLSIFEHCFLANKFKNLDYICVIKFNIESNEIASLPKEKFISKFVFVREKITDEIEKILEFDDIQIERLKPKQYSKGAMYTFIIEGNAIANDILLRMNAAISDGSLVRSFQRIYDLNSNNINGYGLDDNEIGGMSIASLTVMKYENLLNGNNMELNKAYGGNILSATVTATPRNRDGSIIQATDTTVGGDNKDIIEGDNVITTNNEIELADLVV